MVDGSVSNWYQIFRKASSPYQQSQLYRSSYLHIKKDAVFVLKVIEEDKMMLIAAINLSYSKTFIVVDSQWIRYLSEIQSLPLLLLQRKDKIFCIIHMTKENPWVISVPHNALQQFGAQYRNYLLCQNFLNDNKVWVWFSINVRITGILGVLKSVVAKAASNFSTAGPINCVWKAPATARRTCKQISLTS
jgi:hypothetical protein